ncbi:MAG TPA: hypothetical protein VF092_14430 [Longimicrobium sp.]
MRIAFTRKYEWALLPAKHRIPPPPDESAMYERNFRWVRQPRRAERCGPWRLGSDLGWIVRSPVDICLTPVHDVQVAGFEGELTAFWQATGFEEVWPRPNGATAVRRTGWLRLYDIATEDGWRSMFVPNGDGSVEWHLGWEMEFPDTHFVLVLPADVPSGLEVPTGVLNHRAVQRLNAATGFSVAIRPHRTVRLKRGQPFARVVLLHPDSIKATAVEAGPEEEGG